MSKLFSITLLILAFSLLNSQSAEARRGGGFFSFGGEAMAKVQDFPDTEQFQMDDGTYVDAGCIYKQVTILFIPVWNYDIRWCGYTGEDDSYVMMTKEELDVLAKEADITLPESPSLSFWHSIGGKLLFIVVIGGLIAYGIFSSDDEEEEEAPKTEEKPVE
ncbi:MULTISPECIES: hypothetical protein [unclassified Aureispira]|uniref:hypothetical protein n=1 Tax=unclassified Aureispira TaxID=2649989 RepID=UPI0006990BBF|nr:MULTISPECIES: hypothetical protein [unclassified Aureispira]WMX13443.1 hypothetical protein QP953_21585 [Aureispira sp. CCB-E]